MPEGPECYVMTQRLRKKIPANGYLTNLESLCPRYDSGRDALPQPFIKSLPQQVTEVSSKGKKTIVRFKNGWGFLISYGMSGHWQNSCADYAQLKFTFSKSKTSKRLREYYWVSSRSLPTCVVKVLKQSALDAELDKLGLDIIYDDPTPEQVLDVYGKSRKNICGFIMEQTKFCGIGNYIKAVVLYRCQISPHRKVHELDDGQKWLIWETAKEVAQEAIAAQGMGMRDYKDESGNKIGVAFDITPYSMKEDSEGNKVISEDIAGRNTWWVPAVQV